MTNKEILEQEFETIKQELIEKHDKLGMRASGNWASQLLVKVQESGSKIKATLFGEKYTEQLAWGRKPGRFPPIAAIEQWIIDKGIKPIEQNMKTSTLAFLIARKIAREGTKYYQQGGTDLIDAVLTPMRIQEIINKVKEINTETIVSGLIEQLKQVAK